MIKLSHVSLMGYFWKAIEGWNEFYVSKYQCCIFPLNESHAKYGMSIQETVNSVWFRPINRHLIWSFIRVVISSSSSGVFKWLTYINGSWYNRSRACIHWSVKGSSRVKVFPTSIVSSVVWISTSDGRQFSSSVAVNKKKVGQYL